MFKWTKKAKNMILWFHENLYVTLHLITAPLESSEIEVEDPSMDQTAQDSNSEPHMIIPIASGSKQGSFSRENTGEGAVGNGSIQVCQLVDDVK